MEFVAYLQKLNLTKIYGSSSICNTLTPQSKGNHGATDHMFPSVLGQHHDVAQECGTCCLSAGAMSGQYYDISWESGIPFLN